MTYQLVLYIDKLKPERQSWHFFTFIRKLFAPWLTKTKQHPGRRKSDVFSVTVDVVTAHVWA